jgi:hypothetical protein
MVAIYCAYTQQINPVGVTPVLTRAQVWKGLQRKVRKAQDFVPIINDCKVLEDKDDVVIREAKFIPGPDVIPGQGGKIIREVCKLYEPVKVCTIDFHQPNGAVIMNYISDGPGMTDNDLNMTYVFKWLHDNTEAGSEQYKQLYEEHRKGGKVTINKSIKAMRKIAITREL